MKTYVKISRCYYHTNKPAVATCTKCGAGICRECAVKDDFGRVICYECGNKNLRQKHREYRETLKQQGGRFRNASEFVFPSVIGILIITIVGIMGYLMDKTGFINVFLNEGVLGIIAGIVVAYMLFSIPFCMIILNDTFAPKYETLWNRFDKWYFQVALSLFIGWIVLTVYLVRFIVIKTNMKKHKF